MDNKTKMQKDELKNNIDKLDKQQFKMFFTILVHYWVNHKYFINKWNFFNLWCELNELCHETEESFPDPHDDHNLVKSFCQEHPFYFIDMLELELVKKLFCEYLDKDLDTITIATEKLHTGDLRVACESINEAMGLAEDVNELVSQAEEYMKAFS
ncbi:MAG: hypothetical protein IJX76_00995 [Clostridia bacterium]|nr:hypothetical protein [Clostridia bacterium]